MTGFSRAALGVLVAVATLGTAACSGGGDDATGSHHESWSKAAAVACAAHHPTSAAAVPAVDLSAVAPAARSAMLTSLTATAGAAATTGSTLAHLEGSNAPAARKVVLARIAQDADLVQKSASQTDAGIEVALAAAARLDAAATAAAVKLGVPVCAEALGAVLHTHRQTAAPLRVSTECFNDAALHARLGLGPSNSAPAGAVECTKPHDFERFLTFSFPAPKGSPYPAQLTLAAHADTQCATAFTELDGTAPIDSADNYAAVLPSAADWIAGRQDLTCVRFDPSGKPLPSTASAGK